MSLAKGESLDIRAMPSEMAEDGSKKGSKLGSHGLEDRLAAADDDDCQEP